MRTPTIAVHVYQDKVVPAATDKEILPIVAELKRLKERKQIGTYETLKLVPDENGGFRAVPTVVTVTGPRLPKFGQLVTTRSIRVDKETNQIQILESLNNESPRWLDLLPPVWVDGVPHIFDSKRRAVRLDLQG